MEEISPKAIEKLKRFNAFTASRAQFLSV